MIRKNLIILYMVILPLLLVGGCATLPEDFEKPESYATLMRTIPAWAEPVVMK